jgi:hypothetical protein
MLAFQLIGTRMPCTAMSSQAQLGSGAHTCSPVAIRCVYLRDSATANVTSCLASTYGRRICCTLVPAL